MDTFNLVGIAISVFALWIAWRTLKLTQDSLAITKEALEQARSDWAQEKWFDLYFKADQAYNALDDYQVDYQHTNPAVQSPEQIRDFNRLMHLIREVHTMAVVFPKNEATDALFASTQFSNITEALSKDKLKIFMDALELLRQKALVNKDVLRIIEAGDTPISK